MNFYDELLNTKQEEDTLPKVTSPGLLNAVVKEIWDEKHKGMVRVEYLMGEKGRRTSDWVRIMTPYAGNQFGNYWLPEPGTEVILGFIHGNLNLPVVLGCIWNDTDVFPPDTVCEKNETKTLHTKAGNQIIFSDTEKKEKITIKTPCGLTIVADDETASVSIQDKDKKNQILADCKNGNVTITAKSAITLKAGNSSVLKADADSLQLESGTIKITAKQSLRLAGQSTELSGASVKVKANGELGLESGGVAQLKGSMVRLN